MPRPLSSPLLLSFLCLNGFLLLVLLVPQIWPLPAIDEESRDRREAELIASQEVTKDNVIAQILERPLFHLNRRQPVEREEAPVEVVEEKRIEAPYDLVGLMGAGADKTAYIQHKNTGETLAVSAGSSAGAWIVEAIGDDHLTLILDGERRVIQLAGGR